jgi:cytokinin dehydrogenase
MNRLYEELLQSLDGVVYTPDQLRDEHLTNFGHVHYWTPRFLVEPKSADDVANVVKFARRHRLAVSTRGSAHSQSELAINEGGILLAMKSMDRILEVDQQNETVDVESGVVWRDLTHHLKRWNLVPRVLTNNLGVTIGGTLSMAGIGVASFRYGSQGDNVEEIEVVTGEGEKKTCGPDDDPDLFWSVIAGLGQVGIITRARLKLRRCKPMTRTYYLLYDDLRVFMRDAKTAMDNDRWDHLESWASPCPQGTKPVAGRRQVFAKWFFPFHLTVEFDPGSPPDDAALLDDLSPYDNLYTDDLPTIDFMERLVPVFELWRKGGTW